ncbi:hypothetical protein GCM10010168_24690 [Actinoplanes ianthinogenes]|uniref:Lipoprotein n=1 Tax=Actinoplanes ianthinogenes TaxID=122358 RepID=A0ABM7M8V9_9ACTN|nr:hypothetical protein [Actinoplanes ianthinogenes]BCJ48109.1 hypothetical protein Aiant_87660 [Actinoplanes ianthinogenes]GGR06475.1 hypothetical protein GCM10010168_24690 [Actinoplanes ianthinogenes]
MDMRSAVVGTVAVFLLAACSATGGSTDTTAAASPSAAATSVAAVTPASSSAASGGLARCAAVKKAYTAWAKANTSLTTRGAGPVIQAGNAFADAVGAYDDQAAKELKREITGYDVQVLIAQAQIAQGTADSATRENLKKDHDDVVAKYDAFRAAASCE